MFTKPCRLCESIISERYRSKFDRRIYCSRRCLARSKYLKATASKRLLDAPGSLTLANGAKTRISPEDYEWATEYAWAVGARGYVVTNSRGTRPRRQIRLHRMVIERKIGRPLHASEYVDHINHDTLDNRRENLRIATTSENQANRRKQYNSSSRFKGVVRNRNKWQVILTVGTTRLYLGSYADDEEAAYIYDQFALALSGEYAYLNVVNA